MTLFADFTIRVWTQWLWHSLYSVLESLWFNATEQGHLAPTLNIKRTDLYHFIVVFTVFRAFFSVAQRRCFHSDRSPKV